MKRYEVRVIREVTLWVECDNDDQAKYQALEDADKYGNEFFIDILDEYEVTT